MTEEGKAYMARGRPLELEREFLEAFKHSGRVSEYLVGVLPAAIWRAAPPGGRGRTIAAIVAHIQGVRRTFARMGGARPGPLVAYSADMDAFPSTAADPVEFA